MSDISNARLRSVDLTLLLVFVELVRHRKLTTVAARLGLTQSAISHALKRLRDQFDDELFLRRPAGVEPTARALALEPRIAAVVESARALLAEEAPFDPEAANRTIRARMLDFETSLFAGPLAERLRRVAPHMRLSVRSATLRDSIELMARGELDVSVGYFPSLPEAFRSRPLFEENYAVVARKSHPGIGRKLTLDRYARLDHMLVSFDGGFRGIVDQALEGLGRERRVVAALPSFFPALATVAKTDLIATVPRRLAEQQAARFGLVIMDPPLAIRSFVVAAVHHRRLDRDAALQWFMGELEALAGKRAGHQERR